MVSIRFNNFLLVLIMLLLASNSSSYGQQGMEKPIAAKQKVLKVTGSVGILIYEKENVDEVTASTDEITKLGGRKMKLARVLKSTDIHKDEAINAENRNISGATHFMGNNDPNGNEIKKRTHPIKGRTIGFTAFSADYNVPKPHPPKHN